MSIDHRAPSMLPEPPDCPVSLADPLAISAYGAALLAAIEMFCAASGEHGAAARLVAELDDIRQALQAPDAAAIRRSVGLFGRLLGRDVEAQLRADALSVNLDTRLLRADNAALDLQAEAVARMASAARVEQAAKMIARWADAGQTCLQQAAEADIPDLEMARMALARRLQHLRSLAAIRQMEAAQLRLLHAQAVELLERYQRIRDVLLPAWRQQALALEAAQMPARLVQAAQNQSQIVAEVAAMQARLR